MTRRDYRAMLAVQGHIWCRSMFFTDCYISRLPYCAINDLYDACQFERG